MAEEIIKAVYGFYDGDTITDHTTGEIISVVTYGSLRIKIINQIGIYNLKKNEYGDWVIFQGIIGELDVE